MNLKSLLFIKLPLLTLSMMTVATAFPSSRLIIITHMERFSPESELLKTGLSLKYQALSSDFHTISSRQTILGEKLLSLDLKWVSKFNNFLLLGLSAEHFILQNDYMVGSILGFTFLNDSKFLIELEKNDLALISEYRSLDSLNLGLKLQHKNKDLSGTIAITYPLDPSLYLVVTSAATKMESINLNYYGIGLKIFLNTYSFYTVFKSYLGDWYSCYYNIDFYY